MACKLSCNFSFIFIFIDGNQPSGLPSLRHNFDLHSLISFLDVVFLFPVFLLLGSRR